uniref:Uncharacterized protein n=1 Tax=Salix viminalis TaxID=40686 RepID=A0A6N2L1Z6_SALVM
MKKQQSANLAEAFSACSIQELNNPEWFPDSGATSHMTNTPEILDDSAEYTGNERVMDRATGTVLGIGRCENGLYVLDQHHHALVSILSAHKTRAPAQLWHARLGHPNFRSLSSPSSQVPEPVSSSTDAASPTESHVPAIMPSHPPVTSNHHPMITRGKAGIVKPRIELLYNTDASPLQCKETFSHIHKWKSRPSTSSTATVHKKPSATVYCQLCDKEGHLAKRCWSFLKMKKQQSANLAEAFSACSIQELNNPEWFPDSGATSHMTNTPEILDDSAEYTGNERVMVGNGQSLPISHIGSVSTVAPHCSIPLSNVLVVPGIQKNLISISQLTKQLNCRDRATGTVLGIGRCENGLYVLDQHHHALVPEPVSSSTDAASPTESHVPAIMPSHPPVTSNHHPMITRGKAGIVKPSVVRMKVEPEEEHCGVVEARRRIATVVAEEEVLSWGRQEEREVEFCYNSESEGIYKRLHFSPYEALNGSISMDFTLSLVSRSPTPCPSPYWYMHCAIRARFIATPMKIWEVRGLANR